MLYSIWFAKGEIVKLPQSFTPEQAKWPELWGLVAVVNAPTVNGAAMMCMNGQEPWYQSRNVLVQGYLSAINMRPISMGDAIVRIDDPDCVYFLSGHGFTAIQRWKANTKIVSAQLDEKARWLHNLSLQAEQAYSVKDILNGPQ